MNPNQFFRASRINLVFYILLGIGAVFVSYTVTHRPLWFILAAIAYICASSACLITSLKRPTLNKNVYSKMQSIAFVVLNFFLSIAFDSAQVFVYAMCFSSILSLIFIDPKLSKFQFILSTVVALVVAGIVGIYTGSSQTMLAYTFGTVLLVVMNFNILVMTTNVSFQSRKGREQERSLDDMLKVVEAKCEEAQSATRSKTLFLAHMSHEIRTPINVIVGMNEMILRESSEPEITEYASETKNAAKSLLGIINDILDITKIEAGKLTTISVKYDPKILITDIYNLIRFKAEDKGLEFKVIADENIPAQLMGDDIRLKQIVINLLTNAVKYTAKGSVVLDIHPVSDDEIMFSVKDTGMGIKEEDISRLFNAFDRIEEKKNRNIEGTGLGLNITSSLLKLFGSELKVKSVYGKGSEFYFVIKQKVIDPKPMGKIDLKAKNYHEIKYQAQNTAPDAKVLIVDDNEMNRKVFKNLLKNTGVMISEASSGRECLELVAQTAFDMIFMDYMMPEMDGVQTLEEMKRMDGNLSKDAPVIVLTANAVAGAKEFYEKAGFNGFLSKPVSPAKLEAALFAGLPKELVKETGELPKEEEVVLPDVYGADWAFARLHFPDDKQLNETVKMFLKALKMDADELELYFDGIDNEEAVKSYRIKVHSMKSSAALIGIVRLAGMAMELEDAAANGDTDTIKALHPVFIKRWISYKELLKEFSDSTSAAKNADDFKDEIADIIGRIHEAADEMDVDKLDALSAELENYAFSGDEADKAEKIKTAIFSFDLEMLKNCTL